MEWQPFFEPVVDNPYISDFYANMSAWSFHSQIFFLSHRLGIHQSIYKYKGSVIQDRSIYEDAEIFAKNLNKQGHLNDRDYATYCSFYLTLIEYLPPPDLVIYLKASVPTLLNRIKLRNRDYERSINPDYLEQLNVLYEDWISNFTICPVLTVPADNLDYVAHTKHLDLISRKVQQKLTGKEIVQFAPDELIQSLGS